MESLPSLSNFYLSLTSSYLHDTTKVLGKLQQAFLEPGSHDWHYGLEVTMRGISTQTFKVNGQATRALLDLVTHTLRLGGKYWRLCENPPAQLLAEVQNWLTEQAINTKIDEPGFIAQELFYDSTGADDYAVVLWWMERQFSGLRPSLEKGTTSPILLFPHHFDLSIVWFPLQNEKQLAIGFSIGDETITEPYIYVTAYPEPGAIKGATLVNDAYWETTGFSGAVLPYSALYSSSNPEKLLIGFTSNFISKYARI
jgi:hypothetical protein